MTGEQSLRPHHCLLIRHFENAPPPALDYALLGYSSTITSIAVSSAATATPLLTSPCLTLETYLGNGDMFLLLCHLNLFGARVFPTMDFMQVYVVQLFDFRVMIYAHVPCYFFMYTHPLHAVINLNLGSFSTWTSFFL